MANVNPLLLVGAVIGVVTALLVLACALIKDKKETMGFERTMKDGDEKQRIQVSHCRHLPLHLPAFAGLPCGGIRCRYGTIRRAGLRPPPCRPR